MSAYFAPHVGGVERFVEVLAAGLAERSHEVTVLCCRTDPGSPLDERGAFRLVRVPATNAAERRLGVPLPIPSPRALRTRLRSLIAAADVVHAQDALYPSSWAALTIASRQDVPILVTQHVGFVRQRRGALDLAQHMAIRAVGPLMRRANRVVSYNPAVAAWAAQAWKLGTVDVLPSGVSIRRGAPDRTAAGLAEDRFVALFVGRDVQKKGLRHFIAAVDPAYDLVAVTDAALPSRPGLDVRPFMPADDLARLLCSVDALVLPSVDEGVPLVIQEAAVAGIPIVTTAHPGLDRYFGTGDLVVVEPTGDSVRTALLELASDPARCAELSQRVARAGERHFGEAEFVASYEQAYEALAGANRGRGRQ